MAKPTDPKSSEGTAASRAGAAAGAEGAAFAPPPALPIDGEELYCVEGDLLFDEDELRLYREAQQALAARNEAARLTEEAGLSYLKPRENTLLGIVQEGKLVRWEPGTILKYCVLQQTFPRQEWYQEVVENMKAATRDWSDTCGVQFEYVSAADNSGSLRPPEVLFAVRHIDAKGAFIASAFFPNDPPHRRRVLVDPSYHTTDFDRAGVFRHELGHTLGFRHEHIRSGAPAVCPDEDTTGTIDLTQYDPKSVMHYFCGGVGTRELAITSMDRDGSRSVYGPPLSTFELVAAR
ncbi:hypothetical protein C3486_03525 [Streptomyces sp. Ru73]|uniref:matrixin family metalloprotease n=1 Tax=Streptomyces sp. Ru73 TaxID=2080748 RepID=UPI000CDDE65A|nr:matrixin family metalloprotease [Streptomyces sp. Ru73]POX42656.1 hypothetical protein C3486_03525 [Streptomyces sp. Ru73]